MADETPNIKPEIKYLNNQMRIASPLSSGYELKKDITPEIKRNLPSELNENKSHKLNIIESSFIPKLKSCATEKKNDYSGTFYYPNYTNNIINQNYYSQPYYATNYFQTSQNQYQVKETNKNLNVLKPTQNSFIPKSMRINNNKLNEDGNTCLNCNAPYYIPQNLDKSTEKEEEKKEEKKNMGNDEKNNEQNKKTNLFKLLESKDNSKKTKQIGNDKNENTQAYKNKKKQKSFIEQKIDQINSKGKKWKEEEEIQRKDELVNKERTGNSLENWDSKGMTREISLTGYKQKLEEIIQGDPIKKDIRELLNMLTKDNYEQIKQNILAIIRDNVDYQIKFLDILFQKAISERLYVRLYAKLCKELDKELPQKNAPKERKEGKKKQKCTSIMRTKLLDKCKELFNIKKMENFDEYIKGKDPQER